MSKLSILVDGEWTAVNLPRLMQRQEGRLRALLPEDATQLILALANELQAPFYILYVLHTFRGEADPGRYQSPALNETELTEFFRRFGPYLCSDGRFDLWLHSPEDRATLVWDRHNLLFAYGAEDNFFRILKNAGYEAGKVDIPNPHSHHYKPECDAMAATIIGAFDWRWSPLQPEDEQ